MLPAKDQGLPHATTLASNNTKSDNNTFDCAAIIQYEKLAIGAIAGGAYGFLNAFKNGVQQYRQEHRIQQEVLLEGGPHP